MSAIAKEILTTADLDQLKVRLKSTWMTGDYDAFARYMEKDAEVFYQRLGITPGTRLLDVGCGAGQLALIAARAGAVVTGCDIATNWLEKAKLRAAAEGLDVAFEEGDAEALPYEDGQFDAVTSMFGAMFAPRPELVAAELTRVCRPGGIIAMANWTPAGFIGQMFKIIAKHIAPSGMPSPALWGDEATVRDRFRNGFATLKLTPRLYGFEYPFPPDAVVEFFRVNYGPMTRAFASLDSNGQRSLRSDLVRLWAEHNTAAGDTTLVAAEYLEVVATRAGATDAPGPHLLKKEKAAASRRAALLADRIEQGAAGLAAFAETLSEAEWSTPVSQTDHRPVGVIVNHVATMYPIEIDVARAVAGGNAVTDVTWEAVAQINAKNAQENAAVTKASALELLRKNSREAAAAVRALTDAELDQAAPFSLSFGAPMTAQFVIEDHALRHSWHHLAKIRAALKR
ncbi:MAG TPA: methyltransferase domain-containing protein [Candidatus Angelobacter sp.]|jgi:SAM-dependent methyltransferase|nr:methyltransferase domain-containing protein [Candidatus Angelobacter sp.]